MDYKNAGVDIEAGYKSVELMKDAVKGTLRPEVLGGLGGFSGAFSLEKIKEMEEPILLSGTDGCGTKVKLAFIMDKNDTIGIDDDPILLVGFPWFVLRQCPLVWPYGLIPISRRSVVLSVAGIYHDYLIHNAVAVPVVVVEIHLTVKRQASLDNERVGVLVVVVHVLAVVCPVLLCGERSPNIEIHIEDAVALVEEILVE